MMHEMSFLLRPAVATALVVTLSLGLCAPSQAQVADHVFRNFQLNDDHMVEIDGEADPKGEVYSSQEARAFLILSPQVSTPLLLAPGDGMVKSFSIMKLAKSPNGSISLLADTDLRPVSAYQIDGQDVVFAVEGKTVRMKLRPPLLGEHVAQDLKDYSSHYAVKAKEYRPNGGVVDTLKKQQKTVRVRVFFGSWCPACKLSVPNAVRLAEELAGSKVRIDFYGIPRPPAFAKDPEAKKNSISSIPTAIVYVEGQEVGRIQGDSWRSPEEAIERLLSGG